MKNATEILLSANLNAEELLKDITGTCERMIKLGMVEGIKASSEEADVKKRKRKGIESVSVNKKSILILLNQIK